MGSQVEAAWNEDSHEIDEFVVEVPFDVGDGVVGDYKKYLKLNVKYKSLTILEGVATHLFLLNFH